MVYVVNKSYYQEMRWRCQSKVEIIEQEKLNKVFRGYTVPLGTAEKRLGFVSH